MSGKIGFRHAMTPVHNWGGLVVGWVLFFIFVTGTLGYFDTEIDSWARPEIQRQSIPADDAVALGLARLTTVAPNADSWTIGLPGSRDYPNLRVSWSYQQPPEGKERRGNEVLDVHTGEPFEARETRGGQTLYRMHYNLHYMPRVIGQYLVGICSMFMLIALVTGVVIHKKIFVDFFTFRQNKGQRSWLDMHNVLSVMALPFHVMITYSGLIFFVLSYMPLIMLATYGTGADARQAFITEVFPRAQVKPAGEPASLVSLAPMLAEAKREWGEGAVKNIAINLPGDANAQVTLRRKSASVARTPETLVYSGASGERIASPAPKVGGGMSVYFVLLGLHEGLFAGPVLRWLYFLSGLIGSAMIATGLILWSVKRRTKKEKQGIALSRGERLVETLNIGTVVGLPAAIAVYFWANRLLPLDVADRAEWELHCLFLTWMGMLLMAAWRPPAQAWNMALWFAAGAFLGLPVISALTTDRHIIHSLMTGDWVYAGLELTMLAFGAVFAITAWYRRPPQTEATAASKRAAGQARMTVN